MGKYWTLTDAQLFDAKNMALKTITRQRFISDIYIDMTCVYLFDSI